MNGQKRVWALGLLLLSSSAPALELRGRLVPAADAVSAQDLEGTVVWIENGESLPAIAAEPKTRVMNQLDKRFSPAVLAIRAGDKVRFENLDSVFHNVFSLDKANRFDLGLYKGKKHFAADLKTELPDAPTEEPFPTEGKFFVFCNIHPDMLGTIFVFSHGYYAQADRDGLFTLPVPRAGHYRLAVAGPRVDGVKKLEAEASDDGALATLRLDARKSPKKVAHTRKDGEPYEGRGGY